MTARSSPWPFPRATRAVSVVCVATGVAVIAGWHLGIPMLVHVRAGYPPMPYDTAAFLVLCGAVIYASLSGRTTTARMGVAAIFVMAATAWTGLWLDRDLSIERLLVLPTLREAQGATRVSPNAILDITLLAAALWIHIGRHRRNALVATLGSAAAGVGITALLGYGTGIAAAYAWLGLSPMSVHSALAFTLLGVTLVISAWGLGARDDTSVPTWLAAPMGVAVVTITLVLCQALLAEGATRWLVAATLLTGTGLAALVAGVVHLAQSARTALRDAEAARRALEHEASERHAAVHQLRQSEERLRSMFTSAAAGIAEVDLHTRRFLRVNHQMAEMTGYSEEELENMTLLEITHPDDRAAAVDGFRRAVAGNIDVGYYAERRYTRKDGRTIYVHLHGSVLRDEAGRPSVAVLVITDVTRNTIAEVALRDSEQRIRVTFDNAGVGIVDVDVDGRIVAVNDRLCDLLGYTPAELRDRLIYELTSPDDRARTIDDYHALRAGVVDRVTREKRYITRAGGLLWVHVTISAVRNAAGELLRYISTVGDISELKAVEAQREQLLREVAEGRQRLDTIVQQLPAGVTIVSAISGEVVHANEYAERMFGPRIIGHRPGASLSGWHVAGSAADAVHRDRLPLIRALRGETVAGERLRFEHDDGRVLDLSVSAAPIRAPDGTTIEAVATFEDISERVRVADRVRASEGRWRQLAEAMPQLVWSCEAGRACDYFNQPWLEYTGVSPDGQHDGDWLTHIHPADRGAVESAWTMAADEGRPFDCECRIRRRDGVDEWFKIHVVPVCDDRGQILRWYGSSTNVHALRMAEEARAASERQLRALMDHANATVFMKDVTGRYLVINRRGAELIGRSADEIVGRTNQELFPAALADAYTAHDRQVVESGRAAEFEEPGADGHLFGSIKFPVFDAGGTVHAVGAICTDITERKRTDAMLREAERRSRELAEGLREADRRKDEFLATLAHELRNPLAPIRFALKLLETRPGDDDTLRRSCEVMARQVKQLVRLIDDLLDVSRVTRNKIQLRREPVDLRQLMRAAVESAEPQILAASHRLTMVADVDTVLEVDAARIVQVFTNLLNNAAKFTPPGGEILFAATLDGPHAVVRIRDNGMGIAADALAHIFELFHQADTTLERSAGGLGIGLTLAKRLTEMHGGSLAAFSDGPGTGAEFVIRLPVAEVIERVGAPAVVSEAADAPSRCLRVLLVDDNVDAADMLALLVREQGHEAIVVHDGPSAVAAARHRAPDVVFLDIGLPGMNGYDVARALRNHGLKDTPLVAVTGWGQEEDRRRARQAGFDCHVTKPADPAVISRLLDAAAHGMTCAGCNKCIRTPLTRQGDAGSLTRSFMP